MSRTPRNGPATESPTRCAALPGQPRGRLVHSAVHFVADRRLSPSCSRSGCYGRLMFHEDQSTVLAMIQRRIAQSDWKRPVVKELGVCVCHAGMDLINLGAARGSR